MDPKGPMPSCADADFLDSWKIGSSDPVWQTLDVVGGGGNKLAAPAPSTNDTSGSMFAF